jgi:16S rRNA (guanine966-N2)-methyltransferase
MKICGGEFKGRKLKTPKGDKIRPTTDKLREAMFSSLGGEVVGSAVMDLFCGSGALGLEAISRGADRALFVDENRQAIAVLKENIEQLNIWPRVRVFNMNVFKLKPLQISDYGIIFADPPYRKGHLDRLITFLSLPNSNWNGIMVLEHEAEWNLIGGNLELLRRLNSGDSAVSIFLKRKKA